MLPALTTATLTTRPCHLSHRPFLLLLRLQYLPLPPRRPDSSKLPRLLVRRSSSENRSNRSRPSRRSR